MEEIIFYGRNSDLFKVVNEVFEEMFSYIGYYCECRDLNSAPETINREQKPVDIILIDVNDKDRDLVSAKSMREQNKQAGLIYFVSEENMVEIMKASIETRAFGYIQKPVTREKFKKELVEYLEYQEARTIFRSIKNKP